MIDEFGNIILSNNQDIYPEVHKAFENNNVVNPARFIVNVKELLSVLSSAKQILPENNKINVSFRPDGEIIISIKNGEVVTELNAYYRMIFNENWENKYHVNVDCLYLIDILKTVSSDFVSLCVEKVVDGGLHVAPLYFMEDNLNAEKFLMPLRS